MSNQEFISTDLHLDFIEPLVNYINTGQRSAILLLLQDLHYSEVAVLFNQLSADNQKDFIILLSDKLKPEFFAELDESTLSMITSLIPKEVITKILSELDSDDAIYLLENIEDDKRDEILDNLPKVYRQEYKCALEYQPDSAGRLMQTDFFAIPSYWTVDQVIHSLRKIERLPDKFFEIFVVNSKFYPIGSVLLSTLIKTNQNVKISEIMLENNAIITTDTNDEEVAFIFKQYNLVSAPVIDEQKRLVGMITVDDVVEITQEMNQEDLLALAGVDNETVDKKSILTTVHARFGWLFINLLTAIFASFIISFFDVTLQKIVAVAILMPIVASMGGNVATQALAVAIRNLSNKNLTEINTLRVVMMETSVGTLNGLLFAIIISIFVFLWDFYLLNSDLTSAILLSLVIAVAMIINLIAAGFSGVFIPLILSRMGYDPAISSTVFVTTVTDVVGFFTFLGLASLFLL